MSFYRNITVIMVLSTYRNLILSLGSHLQNYAHVESATACR